MNIYLYIHVYGMLGWVQDAVQERIRSRLCEEKDLLTDVMPDEMPIPVIPSRENPSSRKSARSTGRAFLSFGRGPGCRV